MKLDPNFTFSPDHAQQISADPILSFVADHQDAIWHAARLLGGYDCARLVQRCTALLDRDRRLTPRTRTMLGQILAVLSLEKVDDPDLPYAGYFSAIDPLDPVVEEICLLTDQLREALARTDRELDILRVA